MAPNRLTKLDSQVLGLLELLDESPGFGGFHIERWIEAAETAMNKSKKRGHRDAFPSEGSLVGENQISFQVAKTMMETYASGDYKFSDRVRNIVKKHGKNFLDQKCTHIVACHLEPQSVFDKISGNESIEASGFSDESEVAHGKKRNTEDRPVKHCLIYRTVDGDKKLIHFLRGKDSEVKMAWKPEKRSEDYFDDEGYLPGFDFDGHVSLPSDEEYQDLELEPFPEYVEPDLAEFGIIAEDILEVGANNGGVSYSSSDFSTVSSDADDDSSDSGDIVNFQPLNKKPRIKYSPSSSLSSKLPDFLASFKAANDDLQASIIAGKQDHLLEIDDAAEDDREEERPFIEMDLGLGVLEETANRRDSYYDSSDDCEEERPSIKTDLGPGALEETASRRDSYYDSSDEANVASDSNIHLTSKKSDTKKAIIIEEL